VGRVKTRSAFPRSLITKAEERDTTFVSLTEGIDPSMPGALVFHAFGRIASVSIPINLL
jgi:hypothetical protein